MNIHDLIAMLNNRLAFNLRERELASQRGDVAKVSSLDADSAETSATIAVLQSALGA